MKPLLLALSLICAAAPGATAGAAHRETGGKTGVQVLQPWSRPAVAGTNAIGYMVLANHGPAADALAKVDTPIAAKVEIHSSSMAGGIMSMKPVETVGVPAGGQVTFGPGAYHLMIIGLNRTLKAGDQVPATLSFASGARLKVRFAVTSGAPPSVSDGVR
jgi:copper(I)-binding protein